MAKPWFNPLVSLVLLSVALVMRAPAVAATAIGQPAPDFTATDSKSKTAKLSDQRGKIVILEWTNHDCPFVQKHYGSGNMQALQKEAGQQGIVWWSVISSAPGKQDYVTLPQANKLTSP